MANVKPTNELWDRLSHNISKMFEKREKYADDWGHYGHTVEELERLMLHEALPPADRVHIDALGEKYFTTHSNLTVKIAGINYQLSLAPPLLLPDKITEWNHIIVIKNAVVHTVAKKRVEALQKISADKLEFTNQVRDAYHSTPSINTLAKLWPPIMDLLPADIIARMNKKARTKKTVAKVLDESKLVGLSGNMVKAKVSS